MATTLYLGRVRNDAFSKQETAGQIFVVSGRAHGDGNAALDHLAAVKAAQSNLQWLFDCQLILAVVSLRAADGFQLHGNN